MSENRRHLINVVVLGVAFTLLFLTWNVSAVLQPSILNSHNTGFYSLATVYFCFLFGSFVAPAIVEQFGTKTCLIGAAVPYAMFIATEIKVVVPLLYVMSVLVGLAASVLWTAQGTYLNRNGTDETQGRNSGIFWALLNFSLVFGGVVIIVLLPNGDTVPVASARRLYSILTGIAILAILLLCTLRPIHGVVESANASLTMRHRVVLTFALLRRQSVRLLIPLFCASGVSLALFSSYTTMVGGKNPTVVKPLPTDFRPHAIGYTALLQGAGQITGALVLGRLSDRVGNIAVLVGTSLIYLIALVLLAVVFLFTQTPSPLWLALFCGFLLGFADSGVNTQIFAIVGVHHNEAAEKVHGLFRLFQSMFATIGLLYAPHLVLWAQLLLMAVALVSGVWGTVLSVRAAHRETLVNRTERTHAVVLGGLGTVHSDDDDDDDDNAVLLAVQSSLVLDDHDMEMDSI